MVVSLPFLMVSSTVGSLINLPIRIASGVIRLLFLTMGNIVRSVAGQNFFTVGNIIDPLGYLRTPGRPLKALPHSLKSGQKRLDLRLQSLGQLNGTVCIELMVFEH